MSSDNSVLSQSAMADEVTALRDRLREYEAALRSAAPRLAAFKRLEELARRQGSTPEAVASQAAFDVIKREKDAMVTLLQALSTERDQLKGEVAMLLINKTEASRAVGDLRVEHDTLTDEVSHLTEQISRIRGEAVRLMGEREELSAEVQALQSEVRALHEACNPEDAVTVDGASGDGASGNGASGNGASGNGAAAIRVADDRDDDVTTDEAEVVAPATRTKANSIETDVETEQQESEAFDAFFHAEIDHDKSRDWILG